ncbi:MAG: N-acetylmuramoyl-L-alanine amidase family protein [Aeriscardovia sp.]|nr:N-acetylmuramoyl-L-alanine amidase family protein [Aeriscardovia sp.]
MIKKALSIILAVIICMTISIPVFAKTQENEDHYRIVMPAVEDSDCFDISDIQQGIVRAGWGCSLYVALVRETGAESSVTMRSGQETAISVNDDYVTDATWEAILSDGTTAQPIEVEDNGYVLFAVPFEITGTMTVVATVDGVVADQFELSVVGTDIYNNPIEGWRLSFKKWYYILEDGMLKRGWLQDGGSWYYFDDDGIMQTGWQKIDGIWYYMNSSGAMQTGWQKIGGVWYYMNTSGAMTTGWKKINNTWYFFKNSGAMAANEWCEGYWLNANGTWTYQYKGSWKKDSKGWWFGDTSGWYAKSTTQKIDNTDYIFDTAGYWVG